MGCRGDRGRDRLDSVKLWNMGEAGETRTMGTVRKLLEEPGKLRLRETRSAEKQSYFTPKSKGTEVSGVLRLSGNSS